MKNLRSNAEKIFAVLGLTFYTGGLGVGYDNFSLDPTVSTGLIPTPVITAIRYSIWLISILLLCFSWKSALRTVRRDVFIVLVVILEAMSWVWADARYQDYILVTHIRGIVQAATFSWYFATRFSLKEQLKLLAWTLGIGAVASTAFAIAIPSIGRMVYPFPGHWRGLYGHKNTLGGMMALSAIVFLLLPTDKSKNAIYKWIGLGWSIALILLSQSATAIVVFVSVSAFLTIYRNFFRWRGQITILFLAVGGFLLVTIGTLIITNWFALLQGLGRDPTLTGRTYIWEVALSAIQSEDKLMLGFGRGALWAPRNPYAIQAAIRMGGGDPAAHAHNGFIDLLLDIGVIGLLLFLISFVIAYFRALKQGYATKHSEDLWPLAFLTIFVVNNITESLTFRNTGIYIVLYIVIALTVGRSSRTKGAETS